MRIESPETRHTSLNQLTSGTIARVPDPYFRFVDINGTHPLKTAVPNGYVDYLVRKRHGGKVAFFNFELAKEMGLIPKDHPHFLTLALNQHILDTFALIIINEWDIQNHRKFPKADIKPNRYMATRYLQLQHPSKRGTTSGDGRGIWNGQISNQGVAWDVTSSGTGSTCLSPAVAIEKKFFKTGDPQVCYGDGYNTVDDGFNTALMSEILHNNAIPTERTLAIIEFDKGTSVNVRAGHNLLRPSHFFHHVKQGNLPSLRGAIDYFIERQIANREWNPLPEDKNIYTYFAEQMALRFAKLTAQFETEYIFCWMDWDGDNILANAGIIDYGSIRQFGLFHDEYRYDDVNRYSTKITEQRIKARYLVQTFAQIKDFLTVGRKKSIQKFEKDPLLKLFDKEVRYWMDALLLQKIGFTRKQRQLLMTSSRPLVSQFRKNFAHFERTQAKRGVYEVSDGVTSDAIFCMRDALRELPRHYLRNGEEQIDPSLFISIIRSSYAKKKDLKLTAYRLAQIKAFHHNYLRLIHAVARFQYGSNAQKVLVGIAMRSSVINRHDRITGDGIIHATETLLKYRKKVSLPELQALIEHFIQHQILLPASKKSTQKRKPIPLRDRLKLLCDKMLKDIQTHAEGI